MQSSKVVLLSVAGVIIVGAIWYLESQKVSPVSRDSSDDEIRIEDIFTSEVEGVEESTETSDERVEATDTEEMAEVTTEPVAEEEANDQPPAITKTRAERILEKSAQYERAKEISTPDGFINTESLTITELIGNKVILLDVWTYSCINCQRTLPYLTSWHEKYADDGLVIIGLHTPEFEFEKDYDNVLRATEKWGVEYPVVLDNDYSTWRAYNNRYWPRKYLFKFLYSQ